MWYNVGMTVEELKEAILKLSPEERAEFCAWWLEFDSDEWDRQIEADIKAGKFDALVAESEADYRAGRTREL
jgi:hypothetical protein